MFLKLSESLSFYTSKTHSLREKSSTSDLMNKKTLDARLSRSHEFQLLSDLHVLENMIIKETLYGVW